MYFKDEALMKSYEERREEMLGQLNEAPSKQSSIFERFVLGCVMVLFLIALVIVLWGR